MKIAHLTLLLPLFESSPAAAGPALFYDGGGLYKNCALSFDIVDQTRCEGFIMGVAAAMSASKIDGVSACIPDTQHLSDLKIVVFDYIAKHPETRPRYAVNVIAHAFAEHYSCQ